MAGKSPRQHTVIDLFAGCGGLSLGLERAGFKPLLFSELNDSAAATYKTNRASTQLTHNKNIYDLTDAKLRGLKRKWREAGVKEIDLVCGGPPCQGYSGIGHRRSYHVTKAEIPSNHLYKEMIRVIKVVKPRLFLFENVRGLKVGRWTPGGEKGEIWSEVLAAFEGLEDYQVRHEVVYAKDYGVPQNRPRILLVGIRSDLGWRASIDIDPVADGLLPKPSGRAPNPYEVFSDLVDPDYLVKGVTERYPRAAESDFQKAMRTNVKGLVMPKGAPVSDQVYSDHSERIRNKFAHMLANEGQVPDGMKTKKFAQRVLPMEWGKEGPRITATSLPDDYVHYRQPRSLTVREWARLQTFPDWYQFMGPRTTGGVRRAGQPTKGVWDREVPKYTQIGNAVPVRLAEAVGLHLREFLK